jgi:hypothetical protein
LIDVQRFKVTWVRGISFKTNVFVELTREPQVSCFKKERWDFWDASGPSYCPHLKRSANFLVGRLLGQKNLLFFLFANGATAKHFIGLM